MKTKWEVQKGSITVEVASIVKRKDVFVAFFDLKEKYASAELVTEGALAMIRVFGTELTLDSEGEPWVDRHERSTLIILDEPGWHVGVDVQKYTLRITGVRIHGDFKKLPFKLVS